MSKWVEFRDGMLAALDVKEVADTAKQELVSNLSNEGMAALGAVADKFSAQLQEQAKSEDGWNKIRDQFVLPLLISGVIWGAKLVLAKSTQPPKQQ